MMWLSLLLACQTDVKEEETDTGEVGQTYVDADGDGYTEENDCDDSNSHQSPSGRNSMRLTMIAMVKSTMVLGICTIRMLMGMGLVIPMRRCKVMHPQKMLVSRECHDCDDSDELTFPDSDELCDEKDNDCDSLIDEE